MEYEIVSFLFLKANVVIEQFSTKLVSHTNFPSPNFFTNNKCGNWSTCQTLIVYLVHIFWISKISLNRGNDNIC